MTVRRLRTPRTATAVLFFLTGAVFATWAARIPNIQERLQLSAGELSIALVGIEAGALVGLSGGGRLVARLGSPAVLRLGFTAFPPALVAAAAVPTLAGLVIALAAMGAGNSMIDVALNAQGIELERRAGRPLLSRLHSGHSFGVLVGGLVGTILAARDLPVVAHFAVVAASAIAAAQLAAAALVDERGAAVRTSESRQGAGPRGGVRRQPHSALATIGLLAFCAFFVEGAANDWSAVHTRSQHGASPALAAAAFTTFSLTLALARLAGDGVVARWGRTHSIRIAALIAVTGAALVVAAPSAVAALAGWAVLGAGVATIAPTLLGAAPSVISAPPAVAVARLSIIGYSGSFIGPPAIGACAELAGLTAALGLLLVGSMAIAALAPRALREHRRSAGPDCAHIAAVLRSSAANDLP